MLLVLGCGPGFQPENVYTEAKHKLTQGYLDAAFQEADHGYRACEGKNLLWTWKFKVLKAEICLRQNKPGQALELVGDRNPPNLPPDLAATGGIVRGEALCRVNKQNEAQAVFQQFLIPAPRKDLQSQLELAEGRCAALVNRALAKGHYTKAARLAHGEDSFVEGLALLNLGFMLLQEEDYEESIEQLKRVPSVTDSTYVRERALGNLGFISSQLGDWKTAISFSQQAEAMAEQIDDSEGQARWLNDLGRAYFALWELPEAQTYYRRALEIDQRLHDRSGSAACFNNLTLLELRRHDLNEAEKYLKQGKNLQVEAEQLHFAADAAEIALARKRLVESEKIFSDLVSRTGRDKVFQSKVQRGLGRVYWEEGKTAQADQMFRDGIKTAEDAVADLKRPEYRMSFMDQDPFYDAYIQFLIARQKQVDALGIAERNRAQVLAAAVENEKRRAPAITTSGLQTLSRRRKQIILAYSMTDEKTFLWVITPSRFRAFELPGHRYVGLQILAFKRELQEHLNPEESPAATKLYETLVRPAEELIPKGSNVVIIPSKVLSLVNFEALIVPGPRPHYWIDDVDVQVAGSLAMLSEAKSAPIRSPHGMKDLLLVGSPIEASKDFPILQNAPEEIRRVGGHFLAEQETVISGKDATPQTYRASDPGRYHFLHFDAHGVASDLSPLDSAIILSPDNDGSYKLIAREIKDIPLHADLVTISACSGSGTRWYQGEGLVGLAWAFMHAGAHQVVGALWDMDEASSPQLMDDFYSELTHGKSAAEALRDAKLKMLHSNTFYRHPYYWASLQLYTGS